MSSFAKLTNGKTAYQWHGPKNGPILVLVHGLTTPSFVWGPLLPIFTKAGFRVLTYDLFGRGGSDAPYGKQGPEFFVNQLTELLADQNITQPFHLMGYSMGGGIVTWFAHQHPDAIKSLILLAPIGFRTKLGWAETFAKLPLIGDVLMYLLGPHKFRQSAVEEAQLDGADSENTQLQIDATRTTGFARSVLSSMRHMINLDLGPIHAKIITPTCAIWGADDPVIPIDGADLLQQRRPDVEIVKIKHARHGLAYTHAKEVGEAIIRFINTDS